MTEDDLPMPPADADAFNARTAAIVSGMELHPDVEAQQNDIQITNPLHQGSAARKDVPVFSGVLAYFPDAIVEVARLSQHGNDKHNPGEPLHWSRNKSDDHGDCIVRHQLEFDDVDDDGFYHAVKVAWRGLAQLQVLLEQKRGLPMSRGSR